MISMVFIAKSEADDSKFPKELNRVAHIRVIRQPQDIVVGNFCLLLRWWKDSLSTINRCPAEAEQNPAADSCICRRCGQAPLAWLLP